MSRKSNAQLTAEKRLKRLMEDAGIYEPRYEIQIEQTADTMVTIDTFKDTIKREGYISTVMGSMGQTKREPHPLLVPLKNEKDLLIRQLSALGLNKLQEKKSEAREAKKEQDGVLAFLNRN